MKRIILNIGEKSVNLFVIFSFFIVFTASLSTFVKAVKFSVIQAIFSSLLVFISGSIFIILLAFYLYIQIDIRNNLVEINRKLDKNQ